MGVVNNGKVIEIPGLRAISYLEDEQLAVKVGEDGVPRKVAGRVKLVMVHTTLGIPGGKDQRAQLVRPGFGPHAGAGRRAAWYDRENPDKDRSIYGGHHLTIDFDGEVSCHFDLSLIAAFHAGQRAVNEDSIGIEIKQGHKDAELYEGQLEACVLLVDWLTLAFGLQRQLPWPYRARPALRLAKYGANGVMPFWGVVGHRDVSASRGLGDPGDAIYQRLQAAGYEAFDVDQNEDVATWSARQRGAKADDDGIPGSATRRALITNGVPNGLWVRRPNDP